MTAPFVDYSNYDFNLNANLFTTQSSLELIDSQFPYHPTFLDNDLYHDTHSTIGNVQPPFTPITYDPLSIDEPPSLGTDYAIYDNSMSHSSNHPSDSTSPDSASASYSNPQDVNTDPKPESPPPKKPNSVSASRSRIEKRQANTLAARRYRQARLDKLASLEAELKATQLERDALKVQVAKLQGESQALKDLMRGDR